MANLGAFQQVMVIRDKKVISTSKHIVSIWKDAKAAYTDRKTELRGGKPAPDLDRPRPQLIERERRRSHERRPSRERQRSQERPRSHDPPRTHDRRRSVQSSAASSRNPSREPAPLRRAQTAHPSKARAGHHDGVHDDAPERARSHLPRRTSGLRNEATLDRAATQPPTPTPTPPSPSRSLVADMQRMELARRHSSSSIGIRRSSSLARRSFESNRSFGSDVDMDLAYGEMPPPLPPRSVNEEVVLQNKATALSRLLEEANCAQYSARAIIKSLEQNPERMAAVGLALAEISNLLTKAAPGALSSMKMAFPAVAALLMSPEFLIAAGVGVGITVVCLGGYKIIKKIKSGKESDKISEAEQLEEVSQVERINHWRRGISDVDTASVGTSVEGELMTPMAAAQLREQGVIPPKDKQRKKKGKATDTESRSGSRAGSSRSKKDGKGKDKEPSGLRMLLKKI